MENRNWREELLRDLEITKDKPIRKDFDRCLGLIIELIARHSSVTVPQINMFKLYYICSMDTCDIAKYLSNSDKTGTKIKYKEQDVHNAISLILNTIKNSEYIDVLIEGTDKILDEFESSLYDIYKTKRETVIATIQDIQSSPDFTYRDNSKSSRKDNSTNLTLNLDNRIRNILLRNNITNIDQLEGRELQQIARFAGLGAKGLDQLLATCKEKNLYVYNGKFVKYT
jgi:hypothetical protein